MSIVSKATAHWNGDLPHGTGTMKPAHGPDVPFSLGTRFEGKPGSNPEEMIGAALSGCFSMALAAALGAQKLTPTSIQTSAEVKLDKDGPGFTISAIALTTRAAVPGVDGEAFKAIAEETKKQCPVSKALAGVKISLDAALA